MEDTEKLTKDIDELKGILKRIGGANVIIPNIDNDQEILIMRSNYGEKKLMLPGGAIERGESSRHAAQSEAEEETGIIIDEKDFKLIACFIQKVYGMETSASGFLFLYECLTYTGELKTKKTKEVLEVKFMNFEDIIDNREDFSLGYIRMIIHYLRFKEGMVSIPIEARLSDQVDYVTDSTHLII